MSDDHDDLFEPYVIQSVFCDGMTSVDIDRTGNARIVFFEERRESFGRHGVERAVVARLIIPHAVLLEAAARILAGEGRLLDGAVTCEPPSKRH